jgi:hypothetical protein
MKKNLQLLSLILLFALVTQTAWAQDVIESPLLPAKEPPYNGKQIRYTKEGEIDTIIHYRKGQTIRYRNYFRNGGVFQDFRYKHGEEHGRYLMYNEVSGVVFKGKKKAGNRYSGQFDQWDTTINAYRILTYKKGNVVKSQLLSDLYPALDQEN